MVTLKLADNRSCFLTLPSTETRNGVTEVPISAPIIVATARERGKTPDDVNATTIESKAPLLCSIAVAIHPANTPLVVSRMINTMLSASSSPKRMAAFFTSIIPDMKQ